VLKPIRFALAGVVAGATLAASAAPTGAAVTCVSGSAPAPAAVTKSATSVGDATAVLQGKVNPNGCATTYHFEYGLTASYGTNTAETPAGSGTSFVSAVASITGLKPNTTYHFRVVASSVGGTMPGSDVTFTTKPGCIAGVAPTVATLPATRVGPSTATLHGTVDPNGCDTVYHFQYGTTTGYGKVTVTRAAGHGTIPVAAAATIFGLSPNTIYHFRIVATSAGGTMDGSDMSFKTPAGCVRLTLPSATTQAATGVTQTTATLNGAVGTNGCATEYWFQYGRTTHYSNTTTRHKIAAGMGTVPVAASIGGLTRDTLYHFRLVVKNSVGTRFGADRTFRTATAPVSKIRIDSRRPAVRRGFFVALHLHCSAGTTVCAGRVRLFRNGHFLGSHGFAISPRSTNVVLVKLNALGRRLMRHHKQLRHVKVVAHSTHNTAIRFVVLVRTFKP
jgi:hypothetical protein